MLKDYPNSKFAGMDGLELAETVWNRTYFNTREKLSASYNSVEKFVGD